MSSCTLASITRRTRLSQSLGVLVLLFFGCVSNLTAQEMSVSGRMSPGTPVFDAKQSVETRIAAGDIPPSRLYPNVRLDPAVVHRLPRLRTAEMQPEQSTKRARIGAVRVLPQALDALADGDRVRVPGGEATLLGIISEGATGLRLRLTDVNLPPGAKLYVYSLKNPDEIYGAYEGRGPSGDGAFWTPPVEGEGAGVELFVPDAATSHPASARSYFRVADVSHIYQDLATILKMAGACNLDVTSPWSNTARSVGRLQFTEGSGEFVCTGTLLNTTTNSLVPYLLTANHCIDTQTVARTLRVYWFYDSAVPLSSVPRTDGANLLSTGPQSDYTLLRLTGTLPDGLWYSGWTTVRPPTSTPITGIHHPTGDYKRISFGNTRSESCPTGLSCIRVGWSSGTTEGGSSGSGIWTGPASDPRLVGNLFGGAASCSNINGDDFYGRFDVTFPNIEAFLAPANPIDGTQFFVEQHYEDFFNRVADSGGLNFWMNQINSCGTNTTCIEEKRINVSAAFFISIEFQNTGYLIHRFHAASYGNRPSLTESLPRYTTFLADLQQIGANVIVGQPGWESVLEGNKQTFANQWVQRSAFVAAFPNTMTAAGYVDALFANSGVVPTQAERTAAINAFGAGGVDGRARALRNVSDSASVFNRQYNPAFVLMQYFGYLRRNPNDSPEPTLDYRGYQFWLDKLNSFSLPGENVADDSIALSRVRRAEMVKAFINSGEYRARFGTP